MIHFTAQAISMAEKLSLAWPIATKEVDQNQEFVIISDPRAKTHTMMVPEYVSLHPYDFALHLCKAKIGEDVDVVFTTAYAHMIPPTFGEEAEAVKISSTQFGDCWTVTDIWAQDMRYTYWPQLTEEEITAIHLTVAGALERGKPIRDFENRSGMLLLATMEAQRIRHSIFRSPFAGFIRKMSPFYRRRTHELTRYFADLPRLSYRRHEDVKLLEDALRRTSRIFGLELTPTIIIDGCLTTVAF